ncbi:MAG TPA: autotransporter domain-containing protein [Xanthobacteraceae bacterium]|nr:autotransporter domain-containing protein [Xanthobacteraceae bacterium]
MALLTTGALCSAAHAQSATWNGSTPDWNTPTNWTPNTVPTGTATFAATGSASVNNASDPVTIGAINFNAAAQAYTITVEKLLTVNGTGIANNSANAQTFALNVFIVGGNPSLMFQNASSANSGTGTVNYVNAGNIAFNDTSTAGSAHFLNSGSLIAISFGTLGGTETANAGTAVIQNGLHSELGNIFARGENLEFFAHTSAANATITNDGKGFVIFRDQSTAGHASIVNVSSQIVFGALGGTDTATAGNASIENHADTFFFAHTTAGEAFITTNQFGRVSFFDSSTGGNARFAVGAGGVFDISTLTDGGMTAGSIEGAGTFFLGSKALTVGSNNLSTTVSGLISDCVGAPSVHCNVPGATGGSLVKVGSGTLTLSGTNTYTGNTTVNDGMLEVDGSIATSHLTTINNNATLLGTGTVGNLQINSGGTFAPGAFATPGTFMTVQGNLTFQPNALYLVQVDPTASTSATVTGQAALAGDVGATFASGHYITKQYDILHAGSINGTFDTLETLNLPAGVLASLVYTPTDVFLDLSASLPTQGLNLNQLAVANAIDNFFNNGGSLPPGFLSIFGLTGADLGNALTALDGENATGAEHAAFQLMNEFLNLMLDANVDGRSGGGGLLPFAPDQEANFPSDIALAYAGVLKAPPKQTFAQRWTAWASGFGGSARTNGDPVIGSNNVTTNTFGYAAGMDYHYSPDTVLGFALAGGGTGWNLVQGLGTGRSDAFLAGVYGVTHQGPAYIGGSLAFANNWFTTNRTALGDQLSAGFQGQSYAGRLEGGYRFAAPVAHNAIGVTPYAAIQVQNFHTPAYSETDLTAGGFGLTYAAMNGTDTRGELGARFDDHTALNAMPLILRARAAWAHDWVSNPALNASFQALPGAGFTVFGAPIPHDSALTSAGAQLFFTPNWSLLGKFDGEFAKGSQTYAGTGTLRYTW